MTGEWFANHYLSDNWEISKYIKLLLKKVRVKYNRYIYKEIENKKIDIRRKRNVNVNIHTRRPNDLNTNCTSPRKYGEIIPSRVRPKTQKMNVEKQRKFDIQEDKKRKQIFFVLDVVKNFEIEANSKESKAKSKRPISARFFKVMTTDNI